MANKRESRGRIDSSSTLGEPEQLDNGFLRVPIRAARTGILIYHDELGTERKELVPPEELFKKESMRSILHRPVTNQHPFPITDSKEITPTNFRRFGVGWTGISAGSADGRFLDVESFIGDEDAIRKIINERPQVSCGYKTDLVYEPGWWSNSEQKYVLESAGYGQDGVGKTPPFSDGEHFDAIQTNRTYNHIAMCEKGRAGSEVKFVLDSDDNIVVTVGDKRKQEEAMAKVKIGDKEHEVPAEVAEHIKELKSKGENDAVEIKKLNDAMQKFSGQKESEEGEEGEEEGESKDSIRRKDAEAMKGKCDALQKKLDEATDPKKLAGAVKERMAVINAAINHLDAAVIDKMDEMSNLEIMSAVVKADDPECKLDSATEGYIKGRFEIITRSKGGDGGFGEKFMKGRMDAAGTMENQGSRQGHMSRLRNWWKDPENPANKK